MATFDLPDDLAERLEDRAPKVGKKDARDLLVWIVSDWLEKRNPAIPTKNMADTYRPAKKK
jgi:hypothetical protein